MTLLAPSLQSYFTDHAHARKGLSPNTIAAYRDTWRLLIKHLTATTGVPADKIDLGMLDAAAITAFLDHLQDVRGNSVVTRNARLTAIRALLAVALPDHPEHADTIGRVLALPARRRTPRTVHSSPSKRPRRCWPPRTPRPSPGAATRRC
jgi:integrase/recombinase XerD